MLLTDLKFKRDPNDPTKRIPNLPEERTKPLEEFVKTLLKELLYEYKVPMKETVDVVKYTNIPQAEEQKEYFIRFFSDMLGTQFHSLDPQ